MVLELIILNKVSMTNKDKYHDITYMYDSKMIQMNLFAKQKQTHRHRKQTYGYQRGKEIGINRYTLIYRKQINNKDLLYSTGNYIQYLIITYNGKESEKKQIYN